jgi:hypothetical protein
MLESGTVNSDGGQAAAAHFVICYWLFVIYYANHFRGWKPLPQITNNE